MKKVKCKKTGIVAFTHNIDVYKHTIGFIVDKEGIAKSNALFNLHDTTVACVIVDFNHKQTTLADECSMLVVVKRSDYISLCHEATHVAQRIFGWMEETISDINEPFSYLTENIFKAGVEAWKISRKK